jgi:hypothetical protein
MKLLLTIITVLAAGACTTGITHDAQPFVSVLKRDGDCFAQMAGDPLDFTLRLPNCGYKAETRLRAGIDSVQVVIDYGADVPFSGTTVAPRPTVTLTIDGVASDTPIEISDERRVGSRAFFVATFRAPTTLSSNIRIAAGVNAGFHTVVREVLTTVAPQVQLTLLECPLAVCELPGGVGNAHVSITVPGDVPQRVTIRSELDQVPQPDPIPPVVTIPAEGHTQVTASIPVPIAPPDTVWRISAQLGEAPQSELFAVIRPPALITRLTCGSTCALASGDPVGLEIIAPAGIRTLEAFVTTRMSGVPQLVSVRVPLEPRADGTALGLLGLDAPAGAGPWQIDVTVAGYPAPTLVTPVQ